MIGKNLSSYATYGGVGGVNGYYTANSETAPEVLADMTKNGMSVAEATAMNTSHWALEAFPNAAADGTLKLIGDQLFLFDFSVTTLATFTVTVISIIVIVIKAIGDMKTHVRTTKKQMRDQKLQDIEEEKLRLEMETLKKQNELLDKQLAEQEEK